MSISTTLTALAAVMSVGAAVNATPAFATDSDTVSVKVRYGDLNLGTEAGAKAMLQRLRHAAKVICGPDSYDPMTLAFVYAPCVRETTDRAVARFGNPLVTALNGGSPAATQMASSR